MKNKALRKVKLIEKHLVDLQNMGYDVTFNTTADLRYQILENNKKQSIMENIKLTPEELFEKSIKYINIDESDDNFTLYPYPTDPEEQEVFNDLFLKQLTMSKKERKVFDRLVENFKSDYLTK